MISRDDHFDRCVVAVTDRRLKIPLTHDVILVAPTPKIFEILHCARKYNSGYKNMRIYREDG